MVTAKKKIKQSNGGGFGMLSYKNLAVTLEQIIGYGIFWEKNIHGRATVHVKDSGRNMLGWNRWRSMWYERDQGLQETGCHKEFRIYSEGFRKALLEGSEQSSDIFWFLFKRITLTIANIYVLSCYILIYCFDVHPYTTWFSSQWFIKFYFI